MLQDPVVPTIEILQVYGHRICHGRYSKQYSVRADLVATVWYTVSEIHLLGGLPDHWKAPDSTSKDLDKRLLGMTWTLLLC